MGASHTPTCTSLSHTHTHPPLSGERKAWVCFLGSSPPVLSSPLSEPGFDPLLGGGASSLTALGTAVPPLSLVLGAQQVSGQEEEGSFLLRSVLPSLSYPSWPQAGSPQSQHPWESLIPQPHGPWESLLLAAVSSPSQVQLPWDGLRTRHGRQGRKW